MSLDASFHNISRPEVRAISDKEYADRYPMVRIKVRHGGKVVDRIGRVIARTVEKEPHVDVRLSNGEIVPRVLESECKRLKAPQA